MTLRGRLIALAAVLAALLGAVVVSLLGSRTPGCAIAAPRPALPPLLRALGDFDQAYDATAPALDDAAARAATALHPDLIGTVGGAPVSVAAARPTAPRALVVPLRRAQAPTSTAPPLDGLVVFLLDCQGNAYFATVEDDVGAQPPLLDFPTVSAAQAAADLGSRAVLEYTTAPLHPRWTTVVPPSRSLAAR